ncbi:hypothetical protein AQ857_03515 [Burkholderia pseudomallei]|nr:hypothetical protein AQ858_22435 [Burkholderia pseudomallei]OMZ13131.1 hypothetical protein AQ857_03515 [Burkholderia pseudomallei]
MILAIRNALNLATSANETGAEGPAIELLRKFMEYRDSDYVPNVLFDCARTIIDNAMAAAAPASERAAFEAWAVKQGHDVERMESNPDLYEYLPTPYLWAAWQAARSAASPAAEAVVIYQATEGYGIWSDVSRELFEDSSPGRRRIVYSAPQPAQADAPAEAREPQWCADIIADLQGLFDTEGITENDSGDALIRLSDATEAVENAKSSAPADAGEAVAIVRCQPNGAIAMFAPNGKPFDMSAFVGATFYTAPPVARVASLTDKQRESIEHAATWLGRSEDLQNKAHAKRLCALLNGADR